jgi:PhnB protein
MSGTGHTGPARPGFHTITPYLIAQDLDQFLAFVQQVFGATETLCMQGQAGGTHVEVQIGDSMLMIGGGGSWSGQAMPAALYLYLDDVDAVYQRALQAGATTLMEPSDEEDGDRRGGVQDPFGNMWFLARHLRSGAA